MLCANVMHAVFWGIVADARRSVPNGNDEICLSLRRNEVCKSPSEGKE